MSDELERERARLWGSPRPDPLVEPVDYHQGPLDDLDDGRFLRRDDPRRLGAERRRGRPFDDRDIAEHLPPDMP